MHHRRHLDVLFLAKAIQQGGPLFRARTNVFHERWPWIFFQYILENGFIRAELRNKLFQPRLVHNLFEFADLSCLQPRILPLPAVNVCSEKPTRRIRSHSKASSKPNLFKLYAKRIKAPMMQKSICQFQTKHPTVLSLAGVWNLR